MTALPAAGYFTDNLRDNPTAKQAQDDMLAFIRQMLGGSAEATLTIAGGAVTPVAGVHAIDTEGGAGADDLATIVTTNLPDGSVLLIRPVNAAHVVTVKHAAGGAGQIALSGATDLVLDATTKHLLLRRQGNDWIEVFRSVSVVAAASEATAGIAEIITDAEIEGTTPDDARIATQAKIGGWIGRALVPGGRLTLASGVGVMTSDQANKTTVFYTPHVHNLITVWNGTRWQVVEFAEVSQATTDTTKSPAAVGNNLNYDMFGWLDGATFRVTRGPAWSSDTARGAGAGTTELEMLDGRWVNKIAITNGPAAQRGLYLGTIRSDGAAQIDWLLGGAASGGSEARLCVWNMYNRVSARAMVRDSAATWTYTSATKRSANNSAGNRISVVAGLDEEAILAAYECRISTGAAGGALATVHIGLDSTTAQAANSVGGIAYTPSAAALAANGVATFCDLPGLGFRFLQALEAADGTNTATFSAGGDKQGLSAIVRC